LSIAAAFFLVRDWSERESERCGFVLSDFLFPPKKEYKTDGGINFFESSSYQPALDATCVT
jgi:hypothetical protein